jgi:hypothetical protein
MSFCIPKILLAGFAYKKRSKWITIPKLTIIRCFSQTRAFFLWSYNVLQILVRKGDPGFVQFYCRVTKDFDAPEASSEEGFGSGLV